MSMTWIHAALQARGYTNCVTEGGKTAALHQIDGGNAVRFGIKVDVQGVEWEFERVFRGDAGVDDALAALALWRLTQVAATKALQVADLD